MIMDNIQDILKRYYRGETTLAEERYLKEEFRRGHLTEEPALSTGPVQESLPECLYAGIQARHTEATAKTLPGNYI